MGTTHRVEAVTRIVLRITDGGADAALVIDAGDTTQTVRRLRTPVPPETVDGLLAS
jgi:hypothetical protein